nr:hypothetical protein [Comamonas sp. NoAH]
MSRSSQTLSLWMAPTALGVLTIVGLISALFSDGGWGDHLANVCLAIPTCAFIWYGWIRGSNRSD